MILVEKTCLRRPCFLLTAAARAPTFVAHVTFPKRTHSRNGRPEDAELKAVVNCIQAIPDLARTTAKVIRGAVDDVIHGHRTGRYSIQQLTRQEKAHIGTQVEIALVRELFGNREGETLDTLIAGVEVDIKNTIGNNWMIPPEAVGHICLLTSISEVSRTYCMGLIRTNSDLLNRPNRDQKHTISAEGVRRIHWIIRDGEMPVSIFLRLPAATVAQIWSPPGIGQRSPGQARIMQLFRLVQKEKIFRVDLEALAQQQDPAKRARDAKKQLLKENLLVLCGRYDREALLRLAAMILEWMSG